MAQIYDNQHMTGQAAVPLTRILKAPFTRRAWAELAYTLVTFPLALASVTFALPTLYNGILWAGPGGPRLPPVTPATPVTRRFADTRTGKAALPGARLA